jgi:hypothetical protein
MTDRTMDNVQNGDSYESLGVWKSIWENVRKLLLRNNNAYCLKTQRGYYVILIYMYALQVLKGARP